MDSLPCGFQNSGQHEGDSKSREGIVVWPFEGWWKRSLYSCRFPRNSLRWNCSFSPDVIVKYLFSCKIHRGHGTVPATNISHLEKTENHLQECLGGGYVSFQGSALMFVIHFSLQNHRKTWTQNQKMLVQLVVYNFAGEDEGPQSWDVTHPHLSHFWESAQDIVSLRKL